MKHESSSRIPIFSAGTFFGTRERITLRSFTRISFLPTVAMTLASPVAAGSEDGVGVCPYRQVQAKNRSSEPPIMRVDITAVSSTE